MPPPNRHNRYAVPIVAALVAFFLLTSAGLKLHSLLYRPFSAGSPLLSRQAEFGLLEVEMLLALWLLSGWWRRGAWLATSIAFAVFALASVYMAWHGRSSCGCFGEVPVNPWITFGIDVTVLACLFLFRPRSEEQAGKERWFSLRSLRSVGYMTSGTLIFLGIGFLFLSFTHVSPAQALARLRGDLITVEPTTVDGGTAPRGTMKTVVLHLRNNTEQPIRITGGTTDCSCVTTEDLPLTIHPGEMVALHLKFKFTGSSGTFKRTYWLYTDNPQQPMVLAWITGSVVPTL
jgi:hypothetical protein